MGSASVAWSRTVSRLFECAAPAVVCIFEPAVPLIFAGMLVALAAIAGIYFYAMRD